MFRSQNSNLCPEGIDRIEPLGSVQRGRSKRISVGGGTRGICRFFVPVRGIASRITVSCIGRHIEMNQCFGLNKNNQHVASQKFTRNIIILTKGCNFLLSVSYQQNRSIDIEVGLPTGLESPYHRCPVIKRQSQTQMCDIEVLVIQTLLLIQLQCL